jgi:hypothetical protein
VCCRQHAADASLEPWLGTPDRRCLTSEGCRGRQVARGSVKPLLRHAWFEPRDTHSPPPGSGLPPGSQRLADKSPVQAREAMVRGDRLDGVVHPDL